MSLHTGTETSRIIRPFRFLLTAFLLLNGLALFRLAQTATGSGTILGLFKRIRVLQMTPVFLIIAGCLLLLAASFNHTFQSRLRLAAQTLTPVLRRAGWINWIGVSACLFLFPIILLATSRQELTHIFPDFFVFAILTLLVTLFIYGGVRGSSYVLAAVLALLAMTIDLSITKHLVLISSSPFSLFWSESSQIYLASTYFSRWFYGLSLALPAINPTPELLLAPPFLVPGISILAFRIWSQFLWVVFPLLVALVLVRRLMLKNHLHGLILTGCVFLFLVETPVYFDLLLSVLVVLLGFQPQKPLRSVLVVTAASLWVGLSRVNWFPMPGVIAAFIYILETPYQQKSWRYFWPPITWIAAGSFAAVLSSLLFVLYSGNPPYYSLTIFNSQLLWNRLLPHSFSQPGVLIQILIYTLPLFGLTLNWLLRIRAWQGLRIIFLAIFTTIFFLGGLVVSAKIGGGNNIHNMDAFAVLLVIIAAYTLSSRFKTDFVLSHDERAFPQFSSVLCVTIPVLFFFLFNPIQKPEPILNQQETIQAIQDRIQAAQQKDGNARVLFILERQLLTFGYIRDVPLVPEYDQWMLMEMAISGNREYFKGFHQDLQAHRFDLIISQPMKYEDISNLKMWGEENAAWEQWVIGPVLANYQLERHFGNVNLDIYVPAVP